MFFAGAILAQAEANSGSAAVLGREIYPCVTQGAFYPGYGTMRAACVARTRVLGFQSAGMADVLAKAACLGRLWPTEELALELRLKVKNSEVCMDEMALGLALDLMRIAEGTLCA